ncbi:MAG: hypothetical protein M9920_07035 [Verrucomicrobiae bacterium]|nr:hypothetical protein [Verrucomicrobiae bacterium]
MNLKCSSLCSVFFAMIAAMVMTGSSVSATPAETARWARMVHESRSVSMLLERQVFDQTGEKHQNDDKYQIRSQIGGFFFRELTKYADAANYTNSRMYVAGYGNDTRWMVQANDLFVEEAEMNLRTNMLLSFPIGMGQSVRDEVLCWGILNADPTTLVATDGNRFQAAVKRPIWEIPSGGVEVSDTNKDVGRAGWEIRGEVLEFSDAGLPLRLEYVTHGPKGPVRTNLIEYRLDSEAKLPCLPREIRTFKLSGTKKIPHMVYLIEDFHFTAGVMPKEQFLPTVFSDAAPFRANLIVKPEGFFQQMDGKLVKVPDASTVKPIGVKIRYLYILLVVVAGGTLVLALRRRAPEANKGKIL